MFSGFSKSVIGASHVKKNLVCQDSSDFRVADEYAVAVVADGHGSKKHFRSNIGSRCAVEATLETIANFYKDSEEFERTFPQNHKLVIKNIEKQVISTWNHKISKHLEENPVTVQEMSDFEPKEFEAIAPESYYGTTLIAVVAGRGFTFGFQIGDGSLVAIFDDGEAVMPMEYNESAPANITSSMCNANAVTMFNSFYKKDKQLLAACASTDGLYTSFGSDVDFLNYHTIVVSQLSTTPNFKEAVVKNITKRSNFGTEDDISFSCVYNVELLSECSELLESKVAENKEKARKRREKLLNRRQ